MFSHGWNEDRESPAYPNMCRKVECLYQGSTDTVIFILGPMLIINNQGDGYYVEPVYVYVSKNKYLLKIQNKQ